MVGNRSDAAWLVELLDEAFDRKSWHGPNLRGALRGISPEQAAWRPGPGRHNVWEYAVHAAYWKYVVRRRLSGHKRGSFPLKGSNFFSRPVEATEAAWRADLALLEGQHQELRRAVLEADSRTLAVPELLHMVRGAAAHDFYHAGQIRLLRTLCG
jgi:hypothetical protein